VRHLMPHRATHVAVAIVGSLLLAAVPTTTRAQEKTAPNMKYQVSWVGMAAATFEINKLAANGWKLKSASMTQCPTREIGKTYPCVMVIMEKEDR
jgi:hypothetical protein